VLLLLQQQLLLLLRRYCGVLQVVWDDSTPRLFVVPTGSRRLGLLFRANKGQVDFEGATGVTRDEQWWMDVFDVMNNQRHVLL
jgi:hypothetical protein